MSLIEYIHDMLGDKYNSLTFKPSLVHRIDRDTSGCLMIALNKNALENLLFQLQNHKIKKIYHAIVMDTMPGAITATERLLRRDNARDEAKVIVDESGQRAVSFFRPLRHVTVEGNDFSLIECRIETGRTHQIRVHTSYHGYPIIGDRAYGNKKINSFLARHAGVHRQFLHAYALEFVHPKTKKRLKIEAPYLADMQQFLDRK